MKGYLLLPAGRRALLAEHGGRLEDLPGGALALEPLLQVGSGLGRRRQRLLLEPCETNTRVVPCPLRPSPLLQDRSFLCLHFFLDPHGRLHPVTAHASSSGGGSDSGGGSSSPHGGGGGGGAADDGSGGRGGVTQYSIEQSNVQLGVMVRKGVGGTCPLR